MPSSESDDEPPNLPRIRLAREADLSQLFALEQVSFTTDRFSMRTLRALATRPSSVMRVALLSGRVVGYVAALFRTNSKRGRVYGLCVDQKARGQGVGRKLLLAIEADAKQRGAHALRLEVRQDNLVAQYLYGASGYAPLCALPGYYADGCDGVRLEKKLISKKQNPRKGSLVNE